LPSFSFIFYPEPTIQASVLDENLHLKDTMATTNDMLRPQLEVRDQAIKEAAK